jgi:hypothetical protein
MEAAERVHYILSGPEMEVIGVPQNDLRPGSADLVGVETPDGPVRSDRHEGRGVDHAVGEGEMSGAGEALGGLESELEHAAKVTGYPRRIRSI